MKYATAAGFRQALEERIRLESQEHGLSHLRLRKLIVFDRVLARLLAAAPEGWVLKGGVALNLRWEHVARSTNDLDLGRQDTEEEATEHLITAASVDIDDFFAVGIQRTRKFDAMLQGGAGLERLSVPTVALEQHIAEKLHAYTRTYGSESSTRVKDLVDLILAARYGSPHANNLRLSLRSIFNSRGAHPVPDFLPPPPEDWAVAYRNLGHDAHVLEEGRPGIRTGYERAANFLDPILAGTAPEEARWEPASQRWSPPEPERSLRG